MLTLSQFCLTLIKQERIIAQSSCDGRDTNKSPQFTIDDLSQKIAKLEQEVRAQNNG